ncbi:hypothetical protein GCM10022291_17780 [Postechiella marina]|uniref:DUF1569 domain-containing protein n=1 Tax=Postechiella marina TaxID=943941 RepID=A0ABP8C8E9_9FLAO
MKNIFDKKETTKIIDRINNLETTSKPQWGKMSVDQMLAHCNVTYEMALDNIHTKPNGFKTAILKLLIKPIVVSEKPYKKNSKTAPEFLITSSKNFETEKERLINYLNKTQSLGANYFEGKESLSFGKLSKQEWNNMFYKHLDHHLNQFGV